MRILAGFLLVALLFVSPPVQAGTDSQQNRALLIGVDLFVSLGSTYPSSANNVQEIYQALRYSAIPFREIVVPETPVTSVQELGDWIGRAFGGAVEGDCSYLYVSTHGDYDAEGNAVLLLSDGETECRLTAAQLEALFKEIRGTKIVLLDACYSGAFIGKGMRRQPDTVCFRSPEFKVLTSSGAMEESWYWNGREDPGQGSFYFTQILTQGISPRWNYPADQNRDGSVTLSELYRYLLKNHGASTPQVYPQEDETVVFAYDPDAGLPEDSAPIVDAVFSDDVITPDETLTLSYTALRPVRVAYQIVYRSDGRWQFGAAELQYDEAERFTAFGDLAGAILPGRKERTIALSQNGGDLHGYVLVQVLSLEGGRLTVQTGHLLTVAPLSGDPALRVETPETFAMTEGAELPAFVAHALPCALSVTVADSQGETVRRLCYKSPSRPLQMTLEGSCFYWNGLDQAGEPAPAGTYRVLVETLIGDTLYTAQSEPVQITR